MKTSALALMAACIGLVSLTAEAQSKRQPMVGYRNDATGVYPSDCKPVTEWQETEFKEVTYQDHRGRKRKGLEAVGPKPVNIVWKTPVLNYCNGGMVVAGGKLFIQADRGGIGFAKDHVPDFLGNKLVCLDPASGEKLWETDLHHLSKLPEDKAKQVEADLRAANEFFVKGYSGFLKFRRVAGPLVGGGHGLPNYSEKMPEGFEAKYADEAKAFSAVWKEVPPTVEAFKEYAEKNRGAKRMFTWNYTQLAFNNFLKKYFPQEMARRQGLGKYGYDWCAWYGQSSCVGAGMQTPVSDGQNIYVHTGYNDVFCVGMDGKIKWVTWFGPMGDHHGTCLGSPVLVGDVLIVNGSADQSLKKGKYVRGLDKSTGEVLWTLEDFNTGASYTRITPVPFSLPIAGSDETVDVVWTGPGNVIRVSDGKILAEKIGCHGNGRHVGVSKEHHVIVMDNGSSDGGRGTPQTFPKGTVAVQLQAESKDKVTAKLLWSDPKGPSRMVVQDGVVYGFGGRRGEQLESRDLMTGKLLGKAGLPRGMRPPHHFSVIAGEYLFGMQPYGECIVAKIGKSPKIIAVNRLGEREYRPKYDYFSEGSQPFISGNRVFIASWTSVYCIGDPQQKTELSEAHK